MNADDSILQIDPTNRYVCYKEEVGKGAFKTVYKAFDRVEGIEVAWSQVKIEDVASSPPQELERLNEEVELLRSLKHRNILKLFGSWVDEDKKTLNIITELFTSGSLRQYCNKHKKVDIRAVKGWARQILLGLDYLHGQKLPIIHRDIKCDNIFINGNHGEVKIGDFGLAMVMRQDSARSVLGTPGFVAPELYDEDYNELVDIYSFGMCILQMVTSEYPYSECENSAQIFKKVCSGIKPVGLLKVVDPEVKAFIEKCIAPASERLPARELLKDPFLRASRLNGCKPGYPLPYPSLKSSIVPHNPCILSEEPKINDHLNVSCSSRVDFHDDKPPIIDVITSFSEGKFLSRALSIRKRENSDEFVLVAEKKDEHSVSFKLQIARLKALSLRNDFVFHFETDTSITVAARMVEEHKVTVADGVYISELIDTLLVNLISDWHPSVAIDRLAILENKELHSCMTETSSMATLIPSEPSCPELPSLDPLIQPVCGVDDSPKLDGFTDVDDPSSNDDDDEQLKWELEIIKLHYHEVMNYVSRKMNDALVDAGKSAAKKKVPASQPLLKR